RVHQRDRVALGQPARELERGVEVALHLYHARTVHERRGHLPGRDLPLRDEYGAREAGLARVGGGARARVPGGGAHNRLRSLLGRLADRDGHPAVLERAGWVGALELEE